MPNPHFSHHVGLELATNPFFESFEGFGKNIFPGFPNRLSPANNKIVKTADSFFGKYF